jgi:6-phosphogluconolactonase
MAIGRITVVADAVALAAHAADHFIELVGEAKAQRGIVHVALAGGSTPRAMNALLAVSPRRERVDWAAIRFFFGDERCVPPDHPDSNYRMTRETLFDPLGIDPANIFRVMAEDAPEAAALAYDGVLQKEIGDLPVFDIVYLGMGPDGHTASLFPGTIEKIDLTRRCVANFVPKFDGYRITITPRVINAARHVTITAGGAEKAGSLAAVLEGERNTDKYPVQLVSPTDGELHWYVDRAAAANLS